MAPDAAPALHARASEDLRYIREAMTRSAAFTAVPGRGGMAMGAAALAGAVAAAFQSAPRAWLAVWLLTALVAVGLGGVAMARKARSADVSLSRGAGRRFAQALLPPLVAGASLTAVLVRMEVYEVLPSVWLLLYGVAVLGAGIHSVPVVPTFGAWLFGLGFLAVLLPASAGNALLAAGFGAGHVVAGAVIARRHGG